MLKLLIRIFPYNYLFTVSILHKPLTGNRSTAGLI